ncbi:hypothetical protein Plim_0242 [Planctopirus limnophila DSM 3776]|uniref:Uncharacterized protein n=1 Tax=Planctopirus limnophila (strain ATCC 43296 / DSM 3776 / IFAM 1008 / Mu 290) TaxID=521674 RepID=D5SNT9_PLAL2|nr:hypothetical protein Plim_0242 [Planctopirus limnophila DSM 3776]
MNFKLVNQYLSRLMVTSRHETTLKLKYRFTQDTVNSLLLLQLERPAAPFA